MELSEMKRFGIKLDPRDNEVVTTRRGNACNYIIKGEEILQLQKTQKGARKDAYTRSSKRSHES